nr:aminoglycoside phosphotransferase family protein [Microbacterium bovistercoris]
MARMPEAEVEVDVALVRRLLRAQHPDLAGLPARIAENGWDNVMVRLGEELTVRVPRREAAARLVEHEQLVLPRLAGRLPVAVPVPVRVGRPTRFYPWSWSVVPWFEGEVAASLPASERDGWAELWAETLAALHRPADADAPPNPVRGVPLALRMYAISDRMSAFARAGELRARFERDAAAPPYAGPPLWIHGDPHPLNVLCRGGALTALIDFGDVTAGDPATDLATAWMTFTPRGRALFIERYTALTGADAAMWRRARAWAAGMASAMLAASDDHAALAAIGRHTVEQVLGEPPE